MSDQRVENDPFANTTESRREDLSQMSDDELEAIVAKQRAAKEQAKIADVQATAEVAPQIAATQKNIDDMFADMSDSTTRRIEATGERNINRGG